MPTLTLQTLVSRAQGFVTAPVNKELMMLNVKQGVYYALDPIAAEIWSMLEHPAAFQQLVQDLQKRYKVSAEQCKADATAFLEELHANGKVILDNGTA